MEKIKGNVKILNLLGLIFGLTGAGLTLISLVLPAYSVTTILGKTDAKLYEVLDQFVIIYIMVAGLTIMTSLLKNGVLSIISGGGSFLFTCFVMALTDGSLSKKSQLAKNVVNVDVGLYIVFFAAALILTAGILYVVASNMSKKLEFTDEEKASRKKAVKISTIVYVAVSGAVIVGTIVIIALIGILGSSEKREIENQAEIFMEAALNGDEKTVNSMVTVNVKDKYGFMEAYDSELLLESFLTGLGGSSFYYRLDNETIDTLKTVTDKFGDDFIRSYEITGTKYDSSTDTGTVTVKVVMHDENGVGIDLQDRVAKLSDGYMAMHKASVQNTYTYFGETAALAEVFDGVADDVAELLNEYFESQGTMEAVITLTFENVSGTYKVSSIEVS